MSNKCTTDKTRDALKSLEPWADDEIGRLEKTFAAHRRSDDIAASGPESRGSIFAIPFGVLTHRRSDDIAASGPESRGSIFAIPFGVLTKEGFAAGFLLGLISGLALWALVTRF